MMERAGLTLAHLPAPGHPTAGRSGTRYHGVHWSDRRKLPVARRTYPHWAPRKRPSRLPPDATARPARRRRRNDSRGGRSSGRRQRRHMSQPERQAVHQVSRRTRAARAYRRAREPPASAPSPQARRGRQRRHRAGRGRRGRSPRRRPRRRSAGQHLPRRPNAARRTAFRPRRPCARPGGRAQAPAVSLVVSLWPSRSPRLVAFGVWAFLGYRTFNKAVVKSNHRITKATRAALVDPQGGVLSAPDHPARARLRPARPGAGPLRHHHAHAVRPQAPTA